MPNVIDTHGKVVRDVQTPAAFEKDYSKTAHTIFRAVYRELANPRAGTASTKKRDEVAGGGRKPWKQKGPTTLLVLAQDEAKGDAIERCARNLKKVGVTHTGALDVKDVLRYQRIIFTAGAYDEVGARVEGSKK